MFLALVDLNEEPVHKEALNKCELRQDTEIHTCLENKGMYLSILHNFFKLFISF